MDQYQSLNHTTSARRSVAWQNRRSVRSKKGTWCPIVLTEKGSKDRMKEPSFALYARTGWRPKVDVYRCGDGQYSGTANS